MRIEEQKKTQLSTRTYNLVIGGTLLWGFIVNALMCTFLSEFFLAMNPVAVIIGYFVMAVIGIIINKSSNNAITTFIGYNFIVLPVGMLLSIALVAYEPGLILNVCIITAIVTAVMMFLSMLKPEVFLSMGKMLFISLLTVIIIEVLSMLFGIYMPTIWDAIVALIFCGYIGFDWAVAQNQDKTVNNAVKICADLYLDIINLFIRILEIMGKKD